MNAVLAPAFTRLERKYSANERLTVGGRVGVYRPAQILIVESQAADAERLRAALASITADVQRVSTGAAAVRRVAAEGFALVVVDEAAPGVDGFEVLRSIRSFERPPLLIFVSPDDRVERGVEALRNGAADYVVKRPNYERSVVEAVTRALGPAAEQAACDLPRGERAGDATLVGSSPPMLKVRRQIDDFARNEATVLVQGETGTGKEMIVQALHARSLRAGAPLVAVNCAAMPETLIESELFGVKRGAFTGADRDRRGLLAAAEAGTIFLDEVGELPLAVQAKFLRVLETGTYRPLGSAVDGRANVRIIAATNRDLRTQVGEGTFRADLFYRLNVLRIHVPPLRERRTDIPALVQHFVRRLAVGAVPAVDDGAIGQLMAYGWPGNVRELLYAVHRTLAQTPVGPIARFDLGTEDDGDANGVGPRQVSAETLAALLRRHRGRLGLVAAALAVSVRTVQRHMRLHGLARRDFRPSGGTR